MLTIAIYFCASVLALFYLILYFFGNRELLKKVAKLPGPTCYPLLGCVHIFIGNTEDILNNLMNIFNIYPSPIRIVLGPRVFIGVCEPDQIKTVLMSPKAIEKDDIYKFSDPWIGGGLLTAPVSIWRAHRKLIQPAFNSRVLQSFVEVFQKHANILTEEMSAQIHGKEFHLFPLLSSCTLNIICESAMGFSILSEKDRKTRYMEAVERSLQAIFTRATKVWLHPEIIFNLTKTSKVLYESVDYMHSVSNYIIQERRMELESKTSEINSGNRKPFLDLLMESSDSGKKLSDQELRQEVDTLLFGGYDTTANVSCFVLLMLASHPDVQNKVYEELYNLYGSEDPEKIAVKYEDLPQLEYLERVIKETMRLFPISPFLGRKITDDLNMGEYIIPKGCSAAVAVLKIHRDEKYWPNPLEFNPDRFLIEQVKKRHPFTFIPFSSGPRNCIGLVYAMMSMKVLMATILRKFILKKDNIKPVKDIRLKIDILLKPVEPIAIRIEKRVQ